MPHRTPIAGSLPYEKRTITPHLLKKVLNSIAAIHCLLDRRLREIICKSRSTPKRSKYGNLSYSRRPCNSVSGPSTRPARR